MSIYGFSFPTDIRFGPGTRHEVGPSLDSKGVTRPLIVIDKALLGIPVFQELVEELKTGREAGVFSDFRSNPLIDDVTKGVEAFHGHKADSLVAIGGGVAMDVAKAMALMVNHPGSLMEYEDGLPNGRPVDQEIPYLVAVPTTSGTGSEVGRSTVISTMDKVKKVFFDPKLLPQRVFADPEVTVGLPASITAATGMDALTHCVEAYLSKGFHPLCDAIALHGVTMIAKALPKAVKNGADLEARGQMLAGAMMGAIAFQKGLGVCHSLAHALSQICETHHGLANGVLLPAAMRFNSDVVPQRLADLARAAGLKDESAESFIRWIEELKTEIGIPKSLKDINVSADQLDTLADAAILDACHQCNPKDCHRDQLRAIYQDAFGG
ncbi:MAG: iron-containing alcohol dehydrogenase [Planctomycetota bacterium]|nr:iron-containing alcohol dehydrogenase [Planctomycetota bacterium]